MIYRVIALALCAVIGAQAQTSHPTFDVKVTGRGPAMLLIPGLLSSGEVWDSTVERYKDRYTLHTLTLAGFGGPAPVGAPFLPRVRDEIIGYIRDQKLEKPVIVGHSLGGFMAFWIGATAPDLPGAIVAVDGVPFLPGLGNPAATVASVKAQADQVQALYSSFSTDQLVKQSRVGLASMITEPAALERAMGWVAKSDAKATGLAIAEVMATDLRQSVSAITAPTLLIGALGAAPEAMRPAMAKAYAAQVEPIKSVRVVMAEKARHFIMFDDPAFLFATLDEFLASLGR